MYIFIYFFAGWYQEQEVTWAQYLWNPAPLALNVAEFKAEWWDDHFSPWWSASVKLSRRCSAPRWFIGASAACLRSIMAPNPSLPRYCHNGNMCVVTVWYLKASDTIAGAPPPSYINTHTHTHTHAYMHASTLWCTYTHWLCPHSVFRGTSSQKGRLNIFRSNNLSQALRVALVSPSALRTRWLI